MADYGDLKATLAVFMDRIWNQGDFSQIDAYVSERYEVISDPGDPWEGQVLDRQAFSKRVRYSRDAFPDLRFDIEEMIGEGEQVVCSWSMSGTHMGDLPELPASGRTFAIKGITIYSFRDGKVCGHWQAYDRLGFLAQIGYLDR